jgi:hypothetical protein
MGVTTDLAGIILRVSFSSFVPISLLNLLVTLGFFLEQGAAWCGVGKNADKGEEDEKVISVGSGCT